MVIVSSTGIGSSPTDGQGARGDTIRSLPDRPRGRVRDGNDKVPLGDGRLRPQRGSPPPIWVSPRRSSTGWAGSTKASPMPDVKTRSSVTVRVRQAACSYTTRRSGSGATTSGSTSSRCAAAFSAMPSPRSTWPPAPPGAHSSRRSVARKCPRYEVRPLALGVSRRGSNTSMRARSDSPPRAENRIAFWERRAPDSPVLRRLYSMTIGAYIFRGVHEGSRRSRRHARLPSMPFVHGSEMPEISAVIPAYNA